MAHATAQDTSVPQATHRHRRHRRFLRSLRFTDWRKAAAYLLVYSIALYVLWKL